LTVSKKFIAILNMNKLPAAKRAQILSMLCEGASMRSVSRLTGVSINTVSKLLVDAGAACADHHDETIRNVKSQRVQCDEIWSFCYAKVRNVTPAIKEKNAAAGDVWTWTAIDADSKLMISYYVAKRDLPSAKAFTQDVAARLSNRVQLTTDSYRLYLTAIDEAFGTEIDYAQLHKIYSSETTGRYSPAVCIGCKKKEITGSPDPDHISTSYVERANLTMRMSMRRFTRLTNGFSKKIENHMAMIALYTTWYNFIRVHKTLKTTPAIAAGVADKKMEMADVVQMIEDAEMATHAS
jgi:IS1 family transposase